MGKTTWVLVSVEPCGCKVREKVVSPGKWGTLRKTAHCGLHVPPPKREVDTDTGNYYDNYVDGGGW